MEDSEEKQELDELMKEAMEEDSITCPECGEVLEPDDPECICGWENSLVKKGLV